MSQTDSKQFNKFELAFDFKFLNETHKDVFEFKLNFIRQSFIFFISENE